MYTESFACGTKNLMRGLMFESIRILLEGPEGVKWELGLIYF